jgi:uncharacterized membrane protein YgdD (TMEM256/DUF423 family)
MKDRIMAGGGAASAGWIVAAALNGAVSVIAGAFAAHGLDPVAAAGAIDLLHKGSLYEAVHALAMLCVAGLAAAGAIGALWAGRSQWSFLAGTILFPGALYALALGGPNWLGAVAPIGGAGFIAGWLCLAAAALK